MSTPSPKEILQIDGDRIADFIQFHASQRTLSGLVKCLNDDLMGGDERASDMAARALSHLGFADTV
ncbi:hypothetical protein HKCCE4037_08950 [Rhodobacterales bacterium HKCCE4037]|nr:hypothetical protein [Rhodobacterales bacterium HKCCE4037]